MAAAVRSATLYLLPSPLGDSAYHTLPPTVGPQVLALHHFVGEELKHARRYLLHFWKAAGLTPPEIAKRWEGTSLRVLNEHTEPDAVLELLAPLQDGHDMGLFTESGLPAVADPGAGLVQLAHAMGHRVVVLPGASSLLLALAASGLGGQRFAFHGYLPREAGPRKATLQKLEKRSATEDETQLCIEAPYRNLQLLRACADALRPDTLLCLAIDLTLPSEWTHTYTVAAWRKKLLEKQLPDIDKRPAVFLFKHSG